LIAYLDELVVMDDDSLPLEVRYEGEDLEAMHGSTTPDRLFSHVREKRLQGEQGRNDVRWPHT
jgi:hypothetical protein